MRVVDLNIVINENFQIEANSVFHDTYTELLDAMARRDNTFTFNNSNQEITLVPGKIMVIMQTNAREV